MAAAGFIPIVGWAGRAVKGGSAIYKTAKTMNAAEHAMSAYKTADSMKWMAQAEKGLYGLTSANEVNAYLTGKDLLGNEYSGGEQGVTLAGIIGMGSVMKNGKGINASIGSTSNPPGRNGAFNEAKRDANIPRAQQPEKIERVPMRSAEHEGGHVIKDSKGKVVMTREYHYTNNSGEKIIIQDHRAGHVKGGQGPHYNVRPADKPRTGKVEGTKEHYPFN